MYIVCGSYGYKCFAARSRKKRTLKYSSDSIHRQIQSIKIKFKFFPVGTSAFDSNADFVLFITSPGGRNNYLDADDWHQIMDGLEAVTSITSLNGLDGFGRLFAGGQTQLQLQKEQLVSSEAVVAVARLLGRSRTTLTRLDLRSSFCT
jgi:hypothetical protein